LAFIGIFFLGVPFPVIVFGAGLIGWLGGRAGLAAFQAGGHGQDDATDGGMVDGLLGEDLPDHARPTTGRALRVAAVWLALWLVPVLVLLIALGADDTFSRIA